MQPALPSGRMLDISNAVHALGFSGLTVFNVAGNPNKPTVGPTTRTGIRQERWCNLWRSGFRYYLCAHLTFGDQLREWQTWYSRPLFEAETKPRRQSALISIVAAFTEVWCVLMFCSGRLAYTWQWQIGYKPQSTVFYNFYCQSCKRYVSWSCLMLHYRQWTGIYCINSLAICEGSTPSSLVLIFFLSVYRQSFICITFLLKNYLEFRHVMHY
jgi:hypothetical protein